MLTYIWLLPAASSTAWAADAMRRPQETSSAQEIVVSMGAAFVLMGLGIYICSCICLQTIAKKTDADFAWLAWFPVINFILMLNIAQKPLWWFLLCLIPVVNIIPFVFIWMAIAEACGRPAWLGAFILLPPLTLLVPGYLAFSD